MQAVVRVAPGVVEVNYMWLPTWIGLNSILLREMGEKVQDSLIGKSMEEGLAVGHRAVIDFLIARFPEVSGLREYLEGLGKVELKALESNDLNQG